MNPKPPKPTRPLWKGRRMTLITAFRCVDGLLVAADREEASGGSKRSVPKINFFIGDGGWATVVASAGNAATADVAIARIGERLEGMDSSTLKKERDIILKEVLTGTYKDYIWRNPDRERDQLDFSLIVAMNFIHSEEQFLYRTAGIVPQPMANHVCVGAGDELANYLADRLYKPQIKYRELMLLTTFIFREAKRSVRDVGQGTDLCFIFKGAGLSMTGGKVVEQLERDLPSFSDSIRKFWEKTKLMPRWLKDERLDLGAMRRRLKAIGAEKDEQENKKASAGTEAD